MLNYLQQNPNSSSSKIHRGLQTKDALVTIKRDLKDLLTKELISSQGKGRSVVYFIDLA